MTSLPRIHRMQASEWPAYRALRLRALADAPDAFGRTFEEESAYSPEFWEQRLAAGVGSADTHPIVAELDGVWVGLSWGRIDPDDRAVASLYQMWVAPEARGRGVGRLLLDAVTEWARAAGARELRLAVTCGDTPATRLYARAGFLPAGEPEPIRPGSELLGQPMRLQLG